jgi:hypothetical protein
MATKKSKKVKAEANGKPTYKYPDRAERRRRAELGGLRPGRKPKALDSPTAMRRSRHTTQVFLYVSEELMKEIQAFADERFIFHTSEAVRRLVTDGLQFAKVAGSAAAGERA